MEGASAQTHSNTDTDPSKGQTALRQQVKSRGQGPTWGSVKPKNPGSFSARGQEVKKKLLQPVEEREEVGLPGGPRLASLQTALGLRLRGGQLPRPGSPGKAGSV